MHKPIAQIIKKELLTTFLEGRSYKMHFFTKGIFRTGNCGGHKFTHLIIYKTEKQILMNMKELRIEAASFAIIFIDFVLDQD